MSARAAVTLAASWGEFCCSVAALALLARHRGHRAGFGAFGGKKGPVVQTTTASSIPIHPVRCLQGLILPTGGMKRLLEVTAGMVSGQECNPEPWINPCRWDHPSSLPLLQILPEIHVQDRAVPETSLQEGSNGHLLRGLGARDGKGEVGNLRGFRRAPPGGMARGGGAERGMPKGS